MGDEKKKDKILKMEIEYNTRTGECTVSCTGMVKRSEAYRVIQKASKRVYRTWGGKGGLESIGIKSKLKQQNIKTAKLHAEEVKKKAAEIKKAREEQEYILSGKKEEDDRVKEIERKQKLLIEETKKEGEDVKRTKAATR